MGFGMRRSILLVFPDVFIICLTCFSIRTDIISDCIPFHSHPGSSSGPLEFSCLGTASIP